MIILLAGKCLIRRKSLYLNYVKQVTEFLRLVITQIEALNNGNIEQSFAFYEKVKELNNQLTEEEQKLKLGGYSV